MSFQEVTAANDQLYDLREAMRALLEDNRFTEIWQARDYISAVLLRGEDRDEALRSVFGSLPLRGG